MKWVMDTYRWVLETVKRLDDIKSFVVLPNAGWLSELGAGSISPDA
jgi:hypothetical protein